MLKFVDLFAGVGGFHFAFKNKAHCILTSEWDDSAKQTYLLNHTTDKFVGDITTLQTKDIPDFDILCAGFPCQPFSIAGEQLGFSHEKQGNLFFEITRITKDKKPKVIFLENVKNLVSHDKGNTFKIIQEELVKIGYHLTYKVLNAVDFGLPQNRERIYIVGFIDESQKNRFEWPTKSDIHLSLDDCLESNISAKYYQTNTESPSVKKMIDGVKEKNCIYQYRRYYMRMNKKGVCPTLTANMGSGGHNVPLLLDDVGIRKLTPKECFNFQGMQQINLPPIADSKLYKQAGNSVPLTVVSAIANKILESF